MGGIILPNTSLCAIVRDEIINPAGGIIKFIESTVPYVEKAVIVDTGSMDDTRKKLREMQAKYPNLLVRNHKFDDFASSRNYSLQQVDTKKVLILDADERISEENFFELAKIMKEKPAIGYNFGIINYFNDGSSKKINAANNPRIFDVSDNITYINKDKNRFEVPFARKYQNFRFWRLKYAEEVLSLDIPIIHYCVSPEAQRKKENDWYLRIVNSEKSISPSQVSSFSEWKTINPHVLLNSPKNI